MLTSQTIVGLANDRPVTHLCCRWYVEDLAVPCRHFKDSSTDFRRKIKAHREVNPPLTQRVEEVVRCSC
jgi:hypothetical protein